MTSYSIDTSCSKCYVRVFAFCLKNMPGMFYQCIHHYIRPFHTSNSRCAWCYKITHFQHSDWLSVIYLSLNFNQLGCYDLVVYNPTDQERFCQTWRTIIDKHFLSPSEQSLHWNAPCFPALWYNKQKIWTCKSAKYRNYCVQKEILFHSRQF